MEKQIKEVEVTMDAETEAETKEEAIKNTETLINDALLNQGMRPRELFNIKVKD